MWLYVAVPHACFALSVGDGKVTEAPPISRKSVGRAVDAVVAYYRSEGTVLIMSDDGKVLDGCLRPARRIRVHLPDYPTFVLDTCLGVVTGVSLDDARSLIDLPEDEVADKLRKHGATFVDLDAERSTVQVRRGYRSRDTRPKEKK